MSPEYERGRTDERKRIALVILDEARQLLRVRRDPCIHPEVDLLLRLAKQISGLPQ